jgi:hypothetical protein
MSIEYIETQTQDGTLIRIEVESAAKTKTGFGPQTASAEGVEAPLTDAYAQTLATIRACANGIIDTIHNLPLPPSAAAVDFALKIDAKAGALIAKSANEAQFKVSLSWKQAEPEKKEA